MPACPSSWTPISIIHLGLACSFPAFKKYLQETYSKQVSSQEPWPGLSSLSWVVFIFSLDDLSFPWFLCRILSCAVVLFLFCFCFKLSIWLSPCNVN
jgi:hypothetical protein